MVMFKFNLAFLGRQRVYYFKFAGLRHWTGISSGKQRMTHIIPIHERNAHMRSMGGKFLNN